MGIDLSSSQAGEFLPCQCCCTVPASQRKATVVTVDAVNSPLTMRSVPVQKFPAAIQLPALRKIVCDGAQALDYRENPAGPRHHRAPHHGAKILRRGGTGLPSLAHRCHLNLQIACWSENEQRVLPHHFSEAKTCYRRNDERQPATQSSNAGPRNDGAMLIAARFVRADPEVGTIPRRRQFLVADRHRRVHM